MFLRYINKKLMESNNSIKQKNADLLKTVDDFSSENKDLKDLIIKLSSRLEKLENYNQNYFL